MEAAYSALASSSDPTAALAGSESLTAARQRAIKAAALPPPDFRSHAGGVTLSPGAADVAARCAGARCTRVRRFVLAAGEAARLADSGSCAVQHCPDALGVGRRPLPYTPHAFGNRCEPPWNRAALEAVRQLIAPGWRVLEWQTGGSTAWFLARLARVTSIEGAPGEPHLPPACVSQGNAHAVQCLYVRSGGRSTGGGNRCRGAALSCIVGRAASCDGTAPPRPQAVQHPSPLPQACPAAPALARRFLPLPLLPSGALVQKRMVAHHRALPPSPGPSSPRLQALPTRPPR